MLLRVSGRTFAQKTGTHCAKFVQLYSQAAQFANPAARRGVPKIAATAKLLLSRAFGIA
jgi:hypothetical protein